MKTETSEESSALSNLLALLLIPILAPIALIYDGFVVSKLWTWFITPTFHTFTLSIPAAIGLVLLTSYIRSKPGSRNNEDAFVAILAAFAGGMVANTVVLIVGFIVKSWL